jgi:hypothetical protein
MQMIFWSMVLFVWICTFSSLFFGAKQHKSVIGCAYLVVILDIIQQHFIK